MLILNSSIFFPFYFGEGSAFSARFVWVSVAMTSIRSSARFPLSHPCVRITSFSSNGRERPSQNKRESAFSAHFKASPRLNSPRNRMNRAATLTIFGIWADPLVKLSYGGPLGRWMFCPTQTVRLEKKIIIARMSVGNAKMSDGERKLEIFAYC